MLWRIEREYSYCKGYMWMGDPMDLSFIPLPQ